LDNEQQEEKERRAATEGSQNGSGRFVHPSYTAGCDGYCNDVKVTGLLLRESSEGVAVPAEDLRCGVGPVRRWLKLISVSDNRLKKSVWLLATSFIVFGFLCGWVVAVGQAVRMSYDCLVTVRLSAKMWGWVANIFEI
jgi:hypothetical protein